MQINLLHIMNYPLISEYVESIKLAEDNFDESKFKDMKLLMSEYSITSQEMNNTRMIQL